MDNLGKFLIIFIAVTYGVAFIPTLLLTYPTMKTSPFYSERYPKWLVFIWIFITNWLIMPFFIFKYLNNRNK